MKSAKTVLVLALVVASFIAVNELSRERVAETAPGIPAIFDDLPTGAQTHFEANEVPKPLTEQRWVVTSVTGSRAHVMTPSGSIRCAVGIPDGMQIRSGNIVKIRKDQRDSNNNWMYVIQEVQ